MNLSTADASLRHANYYSTLVKEVGQEVLLYLNGDVDTAIKTLDQEFKQIEHSFNTLSNSHTTEQLDRLLIRFAGASAAYFDMRSLFQQKIDWSEIGLQAALRQQHPRDAAALQNNIGVAYRALGLYEQAIRAHRQAAAFFREAGLELETAMTLMNEGIADQLLQRYDEALDCYRQSLDISVRLDNQVLIARTLSNLGNLYVALNQYDQAIDYHQQSLRIKQARGDTPGIALTLGNLGGVYHRKGEYATAHRYYQQSLELSKRIKYAAPIVDTHWRLGRLYEDQGDLRTALDLIEQAIKGAEEAQRPELAEYTAKADALKQRLREDSL